MIDSEDQVPHPRQSIAMAALLEHPVLVAGGGIGGMAVALTLHQIGVPCIVLEAAPALQPLGVGINLQPNAVRELHDLGLGDRLLDAIGLQAREWALVGRNGNDVYAEPRGRLVWKAITMILFAILLDSIDGFLAVLLTIRLV